MTDCKVSVTLAGDFAFATETFRYRIELKEGEIVERLGAVSSVLRRAGSNWKNPSPTLVIPKTSIPEALVCPTGEGEVE